MNTITRIGAAASTLVLAAGIALGASVPASAVVASVGAAGYSAVHDASCSYKPAWSDLELTTTPPQIYARDITSGAGNDTQLVRYRVAITNVSDGQVVSLSNFSATAYARDNAPARFNGNTSLRVPWRGNYKLVIHIQWLSPDGRQVVGAAANEVDRYQYYDGYNTGPYGPMSSCTKAH